MFDRLRRRRKAKANTQNSGEVPWDKQFDGPQSARGEHDDDDRQDAQFDEALLSPSIDSISPPATPRTPEALPTLKPDEKTFRTNGEYYDQLLIRNNPHSPGTCARSPDLSNNLRAPRATGPSRRPPVLRNIGTLRGMPLPLPKRTPLETITIGIDPRSPVPSEQSQFPAQSSQVVGMMAPRPTVSRKKADKPKSLNLKSSAFHTKAKAIYKREPTSASTAQDPRPSPAISVASKASVATSKVGASPLISAASAPAFSSKWRGEFMDLIPQFAAPQTSVPWRKKRPKNILKDRKKFTSDLESTPDDLLGATHISPPMMSNLLSNDPIPPAFLSSGAARSSYGISPASSRSNGSAISAVSAAQVPGVRSTELVVKKNTRFELPVSSGKSLLFS